MRRGPATRAGGQAVVRRPDRQVRPDADPRPRHHRARHRRHGVGLPRLLPARLRRSADGRRRARAPTSSRSSRRARSTSSRAPATPTATPATCCSGSIVERVGREPYAAALERRLLTPLGLTHTRYDPARGGPGLAEGYTPLGLGPAQPATPEGQGWVGAAGALWSTPTDLLAWDLALMDGKVLSPASLATMSTPRRLTDGRTSGYGCGQSIRDRGPALVLQHSGGVAGFGARNALVPSSRSAVAVIANADSAGGVIDAIESRGAGQADAGGRRPDRGRAAGAGDGADAAGADPQRRRRPQRCSARSTAPSSRRRGSRRCPSRSRTPARSPTSRPGVAGRARRHGGVDAAVHGRHHPGLRPHVSHAPTARCSSSCSAGADGAAAVQPQPFGRSSRLSCRLPREADYSGLKTWELTTRSSRARSTC